MGSPKLYFIGCYIGISWVGRPSEVYVWGKIESERLAQSSKNFKWICGKQCCYCLSNKTSEDMSRKYFSRFIL